MRARWLVLLLSLLTTTFAYGQAPATEEPASADGGPTPDGAPKPAPETAPDGAPNPAPEAAPDGLVPALPAAPAAKKSAAPEGAIVVALSRDAHDDARALARAVYRDPLLRPRIDEAMARVLLGGAVAVGDVRQSEIAAVVATLAALSDDGVERRLLASLGVELGAQLVVAVRRDARGTTARVVRMPDASFVALTLTMSSDDEPWRDAVGILRGLVRGPPPGPRSQPRTTKGKPAKRKPAKGAPLADPDAPKEDDDDWDLLTSPWFWGGLGVVVTVGVTVLVLSQTTLNEPDVVMLQGRVPR